MLARNLAIHFSNRPVHYLKGVIELADPLHHQSLVAERLKNVSFKISVQEHR
jgi:hypothetical protein